MEKIIVESKIPHGFEDLFDTFDRRALLFAELFVISCNREFEPEEIKTNKRYRITIEEVDEGKSL